LPDGYNFRIPKNITEIYTAGFSKFNKTVSTVFDINWRTYKKVIKNRFIPNQTYLVGDYRHLQSILLNNAQQAFEGLIADTISNKTDGSVGALGFRNHTLPPPLPFGSTWSEDLLFIEPVTECVDTNLTLDFTIPEDNNITVGRIVDLVITDHGGFANFDKTIPWYDANKTYEFPNLKDRAYFAAWLNNVYVMFYLNVTNPKSKTGPRFQYLDSTVGKTFSLNQRVNDSTTLFDPYYDRLITTQSFGQFARVPSTSFSRNLSSSTFGVSNYPNPFQISKQNFTDISEACAGSNGDSPANISNIAVQCGMVYGAARRRDGTRSLFFDPGSQWTVPIYTCASASKASIKTVTFRYNGTQGLPSLNIVSIKPKTYAKEEDKPLWAVENLTMDKDDVNPIWGLTTPEHQNGPNISTSRQEHLYLPGSSSGTGIVTMPSSGSQNLAGVDFYQNAMAVAYDIDHDKDVSGVPDYSGAANLALFNKWQEFSDSVNVSRVINLIWMDVASNAVLGTRGYLPVPSLPSLQQLAKRDDGAVTTARVPVTVYQRRIRFHLRYGIPAFLVAAICALVAVVAVGMMVCGRATPSRMKRLLDQTSAGRILGTFLYPHDCPPGASRRTWVRAVGRKRIDLGAVRPVAMDAPAGGSSHGPHVNQEYGGKEDGVSISLQSLHSPQPYSPFNATSAPGPYGQTPQPSAVDVTSTYTYVPPQPGMASSNVQTGYGNGGYTGYHSTAS
jgi:hypothetical protein